MRFLFSSKNLSGYTGSSHLVLGLAKRLAQQGEDVEIFANTVRKSLLAGTGISLHAVRKNLFKAKMSRTDFIARHFVHAFQGNYDVCVGNGDEFFQDILYLHNCENRLYELLNGGTPVADTPVSETSKIFGYMLKNRLFQTLCVCSELVKRDVVERYAVPADRIVVTSAPLDTDLFFPGDRDAARAKLRKAHAVPADRPFIVGLICSGNLAKRGVSTFFDVISRLPGDIAKKTHVVLVGKGSLAPYAANRPESLTFIPHTSHDAIPDLMRGLDVMVFPAVFEEFGLVVSEAILCGTPVLTSRMVGASESFTGLHADALIDQPDAGLLAERLVHFLCDEGYRNALTRETGSMLPGVSWETYFASFQQVVAALPGHAAR